MFLAACFLALLALPAPASEFFVAPDGRSAGDGSLVRPWDLATALTQPPAVRPGDKIWLRGGVYRFARGFNILCGLRGTAEAPITVAQYPGERATVDIKGSANGFFFTTSPNPKGPAYVDFKDFEVTNSERNRIPGLPAAMCVRASDHLRFINLVIHDTGEAFALTPEATNTEVYGNLVYYNGALSGLEHGIYVQSVGGYKKVIDNVVFDNAGYGLHAFPHAKDSSLLNVSLVGNISFDNGILGGMAPQPDLLLGGDAVAVSPVVDGNMTYKAEPKSLWNQQIGYGAGCRSPRVENNYFVGATVLTSCTQDLVLAGNTFRGSVGVRANGTDGSLSGRILRWIGRLGIGSGLPGLSVDEFPRNRFDETATANRVFIRPNQYEPGRANVAVYNWSHDRVVDLDPRPVLRPGDRFELRAARDFFGQPVLTGRYDGAPLKVPMANPKAAAPVGFDPPAPSRPEFEAFVLLRVGGTS